MKITHKMTMRIATMASLLFALALAGTTARCADAPAAPAAPAILVSQPPRFDIKDIFGRVIAGDDLKGWIIIYGLGNEDNAEKAVEWLKQLTIAFPEAEGIMYVCVADASRYSKVLQPIIKKVLKKEYTKNINDLKARFVAKNIKFTYKLEDRYILVIDTKAEIFDLFGISGERDKPHAIIVDGSHRVLAHFTDNTPELQDALAKAINERDAQKKFAAVKMAQRKKKMWTRYALIGGLVYIIAK